MKNLILKLMTKSTKTQIKSSGRNQLEQALDIARAHGGKIVTKPYYNDKGFIAHPPMNTQGKEIKDPRHNAYDLPNEVTSHMDNDDYKL